MKAIDIIHSRLTGVKGSGPKYTSFCPSHSDRNGRSLSIDDSPIDKVLVHCFVGCTFEEIANAMGLAKSDFFKDDRGEGVRIPPKSTATVQHLGLTLSQYAETKQLPEEFLRSQGLRDFRYMGTSAVRMPYKAQDDATASPVRFRIALEGKDRFLWRKGDKLCLYGLDRLEEARRKNHVVLVEGESDTHTLRFHGIPVLGIPGAANWREDRDAQHLDGIEIIYIIVEPDQGGDAVQNWLAKSRIRDRAHLVDLGVYKDPSGLYLDDPDRFSQRWAEYVEKSIPWVKYEIEQAEIDRQTAWEMCKVLASRLNILDVFASDIRSSGVVGEERACKLIFLILITRLLDRIVSAAIKGPSSAGKSFVLEGVLGFFPASAYYTLSAMSERALAYSKEPVKHRFLVMVEAAGMNSDFASYLIRSLLSEGRIRYETVERTPEGLKARLIEREGPTGLLVTTTRVSLHPENETRLFSLLISDTDDQTGRILHAMADEGDDNKVDMERWHALQTWLDGGNNIVFIPYASSLVDLIPPVAVRLRRDFGSFLSLIKAHAILHQVNRERDYQGRIVANIDSDYVVVRGLVGDLVSEGVNATVSPTVRETVSAVRELAIEDREGVGVALLSTKLKLDKSAASRRAMAARDKGYLKNLEDRRGRPARYILGDNLPDDLEILPSVEILKEKCCSVADEVEGILAPPSPLAPSPDEIKV